MFKKFLKHLRPKSIYEDAAKFRSTFGLGGILFLLYFLLIITGIFLMLYYIPYPEAAYLSLKKIINIIPYGRLIRNIHRICGDLMIIFSLLHMLRIIYSKAIDTNIRKINWITGALLFLLLFPFNFTGYLLPWDTLSFWGANIVLSLLNNIPIIGNSLRVIISGSNSSINEITLIRFYTYHVFILPLIFSILLMNHFYLIRAAGGIKVKNKKRKIKITTLMEKELIVALIFIIILIILCFKFYNAPLFENANSDKIPEIIKAPWYFASIQFLLTYLPSLIAGILIPLFYAIFTIFFYKVKNLFIFILVNLIFLIITMIEVL